MIGIIDYGAGNLNSICKAFEHIGFETEIIEKEINPSVRNVIARNAELIAEDMFTFMLPLQVAPFFDEADEQFQVFRAPVIESQALRTHRLAKLFRADLHLVERHLSVLTSQGQLCLFFGQFLQARPEKSEFFLKAIDVLLKALRVIYGAIENVDVVCSPGAVKH